MQMSALDASLVAWARDASVPAVLGMARIGACFAWLPYLSSGVMPSKMTRSVVALATLVGMWPVTAQALLPTDMLAMTGAMLVEVLIGTAIGLAVALPFHIFHGFGAIVDNQRGAGVGAMLDPVSGVEATETANLIQLMSVMVFLASGGMRVLLDVLQESYALVPMGGMPALQLQPLQSFAGAVLAGAVRMALPVLLLLFLVEVMLGVLSRYAQQMNAFSVSLAVKSLIAFLALLIYLMPTVVQEVPRLRDGSDALRMLRPAAHED